ncbi:MAG: hypothetical protein GF398_00560 [Chitinivibrionales bacterium]|nr:hypothetical protein [Chitinivibrionales bacterium]
MNKLLLFTSLCLAVTAQATTLTEVITNLRVHNDAIQTYAADVDMYVRSG